MKRKVTKHMQWGR